jgi:hypothetical protein
VNSKEKVRALVVVVALLTVYFSLVEADVIETAAVLPLVELEALEALSILNLLEPALERAQ